jgi:hypothetical protein
MWPEYSLVDIGPLSVLVLLPLTGLCGEGVTVCVSLGTAPDFGFAILFFASKKITVRGSEKPGRPLLLLSLVNRAAFA